MHGWLDHRAERPADIPDDSRKRAMEFEAELKDQELKWVKGDDITRPR